MLVSATQSLFRYACVAMIASLMSCQSQDTQHQQEESSQTPSDSAHVEDSTAHWDYFGEEGPKRWADLDIHYSPCADGKHQSPINIVTEGNMVEHRLAFNYGISSENILNNGHTVELLYDMGSKVTFDDKEYDLLQFHFHTPAEHLIDDERYPMEMHMVHRSKDTAYLVISLLYQEGEENAFIRDWVNTIPKEKTEGAVHEMKDIDLRHAFPGQQSFLAYKGSFTTPPCTEGVQWIVFKSAVEASPAQIKTFTSAEGLNARPVQDINERHVEEFSL